jgi:hypothetical protein
VSAECSAVLIALFQVLPGVEFTAWGISQKLSLQGRLLYIREKGQREPEPLRADAPPRHQFLQRTQPTPQFRRKKPKQNNNYNKEGRKERKKGKAKKRLKQE